MSKLPPWDEDPKYKRLWDVNEIEKLPDESATNVLSRNLTRNQLAAFGTQRAEMCGSCKHFNQNRVQDPKNKRALMQYVRYEAEWKVEHLAHDHRDLGICDARTGGSRDNYMTGPFAIACELHRPNGRRR